MVARELANLPPTKIRWKERVFTENHVFVLRDFPGADAATVIKIATKIGADGAMVRAVPAVPAVKRRE